MENFIKLIEQCIQCRDENKLKINLGFIQNILNLLFNQVQNVDTPKDAELIFNLLENIQVVLARAVFKEGVIVTPEINKFISDFDRIDDRETRVFLYLKIKSISNIG